MANNYFGMQLYHSSNFTFRDNEFSENVYNIGVYGIDLQDYVHDIDSSNTVDGKPIYYLVNRQNLAVNPLTFPNVGYLAIINSTNITAENLVLTKNDQGLLIASTRNSRIINNQIANNTYGIYLDILSSNITISKNNIRNQSWNGILFQNSFNNTLIYNTLSHNEIGVRLKSSFNNTLTFNTMANNSRGGVWLDYSFNNTLTYNNIINNSAETISDAGVSLYQSYLNKIFHNNFINNQRQAYTPLGNFWDDSYPSGGNYWSNYTGVDLYSGFDQDETGSDGVGGTAHVIDEYNRDRYPLMAPFTAFDAGVWNGEACSVDIVSNSTLSDFKLNVTQKTLSFNVTGIGGRAGFSRITIPNIIVEDLWQGNYTVLLNGELWPFRKWTDHENTYIYVNYTHSEHQIIIIPEFPSAIILPLFMVLSIIAVVFASKKRKKQDSTAKAPFL